MQYSRSHIGQLTQFPVGDRFNHCRIFDNPRVCHQKSGNIRPVLVKISVNGLCHKRSGDIRSSSGKGGYVSIRIASVKSRNDRTSGIFQALLQHGIGLFRIKTSVFVEEDHISGIDKLKLQIGSHNQSVQVFASGGRVLPSCFLLKLLPDLFKLFLKRKSKGKPVDDFLIAGCNELPLLRIIQPFLGLVIA